MNVTVWKILLSTGCTHAPIGLLHDLFRIVARPRTTDHHDLAKPAREYIENIWSILQEDAMVILADPDGTKLERWIKLYREDQPGFEREALDWIRHCRSKKEWR